MVKSMTGFGKITIENGNRKVVIEIKSLNSKTLDLNLKMPNLYKEKEMEIRNIVKEQLDRGKVEMCIYFDNTESDKDVTINKPVVTQYFNQLLDIANELGIEADKNKILQTVMRFPDTLQIKSEELEDTEWEALEAGIKKALEEINKFRIQEGKALIKDICHRIELIQELSAQVPQFEVKRVEVIRQKLQEKMNGRIFKISMKTGWNRKLSTTWKNWISQKRKSGWPITVNTFWKRSNMKMLRAGKSVLSLRKSVGRSTPWALKPTTTTSRNSSLK